MIARSLILFAIVNLSYELENRPLHDQLFQTKCGKDVIGIVISKKKLEGKEVKSSHLLDKSCAAKDNGTHLIASTSFEKCGTIKRIQENGKFFVNELSVHFETETDNSPSCLAVQYRFTCFDAKGGNRIARDAKGLVPRDTLTNEAVSVGPSFVTSPCNGQYNRSTLVPFGLSQPGVSLGIEESRISSAITSKRRIKVCKPVMRSGKHGISIRLFSDSSFTMPILDSYVTDKQSVDIYYEIELALNDTEVHIGMDSCYATPDEDPSNKIVYYLVKNGCVLDNTVQFYPSERRAIRFSVQSFKFPQKINGKMYMHCNVHVCEIDDFYSKCRQGCTQDFDSRGKREAEVSIVAELIRPKVPQDIAIHCLDQRRRITINKDFFKDRGAEDFHLNDQSCKASENSTHFILEYLEGQCGSQRSRKGSIITFINKLFIRQRGTNRRVAVKNIHCDSPIHDMKDSVYAKFRLSKPRRFVMIKSEGAYSIHFKIKVGKKVSGNFSSSPISIDARAYGRVLSITTHDKSNHLSSSINQCFLQPTTSSMKKIPVVKTGCMASKLVLFHEHKANKENIRIFMDPSLIRQRKKSLLLCSINVCNDADPECMKSCDRNFIKDNRAIRLRKRQLKDNAAMNINCGQKEMTVSVQKDSLPPVEAVNLRLNDPSCRALENETHFFISAPLGRCGTKVVQDRDALIYSNEIRQDVPGEIIVRRKLVHIPFRCLYHARASATSAEFRLKSPTVLFGGSAKGVYEVKIKIFSDSTFTKERKRVLALVDPKEDMFFEVAMAIKESKLAIALDQCYGRPTGTVNKREKYVFIRQGCPVDETVKMYKSPSLGQARFSIKPFQFSSKTVNSIYVTCAVSACNPDDPQADCFKKCSK